MRHLQRPLPAPGCLSELDHQHHQWSLHAPNAEGRAEIWEKLAEMQGKFCCYCESIATEDNRHIEHFFNKGRNKDGDTPYKHLTFDWDNLFGSCGHRAGDTCGHYKDRAGSSGPGDYNPAHLIKPDSDNPCDFFEYLSTGVINVKPGLCHADEHRAKETLRVLNLSALNGVRKRQIDTFRKEIDALLQINPKHDMLMEELDSIKQNIMSQRFRTSVLCALFGGA